MSDETLARRKRLYDSTEEEKYKTMHWGWEIPDILEFQGIRILRIRGKISGSVASGYPNLGYPTKNQDIHGYLDPKIIIKN